MGIEWIMKSGWSLYDRSINKEQVLDDVSKVISEAEPDFTF